MSPSAQASDMDGDMLIQLVSKAVNAIMTRLQSKYRRPFVPCTFSLTGWSSGKTLDYRAGGHRFEPRSSSNRHQNGKVNMGFLI